MKGFLAIALVIAGASQTEPPAGMELEANGRTCVALAIFSEARGEPLAGQIAVAEVIRARVASSDYPDDLCRVVMEQDQFHGVRDWPQGTRPEAINATAWTLALEITDAVMLGQIVSECAGATYFYAGDEPGWARNEPRVCELGGHAFRGGK